MANFPDPLEFGKYGCPNTSEYTWPKHHLFKGLGERGSSHSLAHEEKQDLSKLLENCWYGAFRLNIVLSLHLHIYA